MYKQLFLLFFTCFARMCSMECEMHEFAKKEEKNEQSDNLQQNNNDESLAKEKEIIDNLFYLIGIDDRPEFYVALRQVPQSIDLNKRYAYKSHSTLLGFAVSLNRRGICRMLCAHGVDINAKTDEPPMPILHKALLTGDDLLVNFFINNKKLDINAIDHKGYHALHHIVLLYRDIFIIPCLELGADRNIKASNDKTPLDLAHEWTNQEAIKRLGFKSDKKK